MKSIIIELDVEVPMRDGTVLRADIYRPADAGTYPVLLQRIPYDKLGLAATVLALDVTTAVKRGFIVVQQDTRGRFASDGEWLPFAYEHTDGYDTVQWAAVLPGSNGKVGMFGKSYSGQTQWAAAMEQPPALAAIAPQVTWSDPDDGIFFRGGAIELGNNGYWALGQSLGQLPKVTAPEDLEAAIRTTTRDFDDLASRTYWELPAGYLPAVIRTGLPDIGIRRALDNPDTADELRVKGHHDQVTVPSLNVGGWYDIFHQGTLDNYMAMRERGVATRLVMGPWNHMHMPALQAGHIGERNFRSASVVPPAPGVASLTDLQLDFFDQYLRETADTATEDLPVRIFVMGLNEWRDEKDWPLERAVPTPLYLHPAGSLSFDPPARNGSQTAFVYDPSDPVLTCGGGLVMSNEFPPGPKDQAAVEDRGDVLVFTTAVLEKDLEITGRVEAVIHATTDVTTTDWVVRLCDVDEDGRSYNVVDGVTRARTQPGKITSHAVDLWSTSIVVRAGHRIRVQVTSSNFPRWDRNTNNDDPTKLLVAHQIVHHDEAHPSHIVIPVVH